MTDLEEPMTLPPLAPLPDRAPEGHGPRELRASFRTVVLVCRECEKRSSGPRKLKSKAVRKALKEAARGARGQVRVMATTCMGPCPKKAMTVAMVGGDAPARVVGLEHLDQLPALTEAWPRR